MTGEEERGAVLVEHDGSPYRTARLVLVTGGAKSGKSYFAERLAAGVSEQVVYVATAQVLDGEMADRVARHQARRPPGWTTLEAPLDLGAALAALPTAAGAVLIDCLTIWTSNRLLALGDPDRQGWWDGVAELERSLPAELETAVATAQDQVRCLILVTNEVGCGVVPATPLGRAFRDLLGAVTQRVAARCDAVYLVTAGLAVELTGRAVSPGDAAGLLGMGPTGGSDLSRPASALLKTKKE
jgi:adenosylcobinamide kinase/adenosylcobinamide-phosphate guanylyltransferase